MEPDNENGLEEFLKIGPKHGSKDEGEASQEPLTVKKAVELLAEGKFQDCVCKFCLNITSTLYEIDQVFKIAGRKVFHNVAIRDMLSSIYPFQLTEEPNVPNKICDRCLDRTISSYLFTQQCDLSERALQNCVKDIYDKLYSLDPLEPVRKRGRQKLYPNTNVLYSSHEYVIDYAEPLMCLINKGSDLDEDKNKSTTINPLACPKCWQEFSSLELRMNHESIHPKTMWYACRICGRSFPKALAYKRHIFDVHSNIKPSNPFERPTVSCRCECGHTTENYSSHLQHVEKHKFKNVMDHIVNRKIDKLCTVCLNKNASMVDLNTSVRLHGGYPEITGERSLYNILHTTLPNTKPTNKYEDLFVPSNANLLKWKIKAVENEKRVAEAANKSVASKTSIPVDVGRETIKDKETQTIVPTQATVPKSFERPLSNPKNTSVINKSTSVSSHVGSSTNKRSAQDSTKLKNNKKICSAQISKGFGNQTLNSQNFTYRFSKPKNIDSIFQNFTYVFKKPIYVDSDNECVIVDSTIKTATNKKSDSEKSLKIQADKCINVDNKTNVNQSSNVEHPLEENSDPVINKKSKPEIEVRTSNLITKTSDPEQIPKIIEDKPANKAHLAQDYKNEKQLCMNCLVFNKPTCEKCRILDDNKVKIKDQKETVKKVKCQYRCVFKNSPKCLYCGEINLKQYREHVTQREEYSQPTYNTTNTLLKFDCDDIVDANPPKKFKSTYEEKDKRTKFSNWKCSCCLSENDNDRYFCFCCGSHKPNKVNCPIEINFDTFNKKVSAPFSFSSAKSEIKKPEPEINLEKQIQVAVKVDENVPVTVPKEEKIDAKPPHKENVVAASVNSTLPQISNVKTVFSFGATPVVSVSAEKSAIPKQTTDALTHDIEMGESANFMNKKETNPTFQFTHNTINTPVLGGATIKFPVMDKPNTPFKEATPNLLPTSVLSAGPPAFPGNISLLGSNPLTFPTPSMFPSEVQFNIGTNFTPNDKTVRKIRKPKRRIT